MSEDNFSFTPVTHRDEKQSEEAAVQHGCAIACPLSKIPATVWKSLLKPPFRKRHPVVFTLFVLLLLLLAAVMGQFLFSGKSPLEDRERIALVNIRGPIMDVAPILEWLGKIENNKLVRGVLVRVDSPGGGAAASQEIYAALARIGRKIPIVVSMGATAASGGLMVSMAGQKIFANPSTVTGSIGVRMDIPQLQGLLGKLGIGQETLVTAPYKDAASYLHPLTPQDRTYLESVLKDMHEQFVTIVADGRKMPRQKAASLANGKIFTGAEAMRLGLVDAMGGQEAAHAWIAQKTGVPFSRALLKEKVKKSRIIEQLLAVGKALAVFADGSDDEYGKMVSNFTQPAFLYQF